jgi:hypothetical protein
MANELAPHAEWQRLYEHYHAMSDDELLGLAAKIDDLTEIAADVLRREMKDRRLTTAAPFARDPIHIAAVEAAEVEDLAPGETALMTCFDAIEAGRACEFLEEREIDFELRDVSRPQSGMRSFDSLPPVMLKLVVKKRDKQQAMEVLREKMGLFPLQEVEIADVPVDDGAVYSLGDFARREEAEEVARILDDAHIWHRIAPNPDGTEKDENLFALEVREVDLMRAGDLVEKAMDLQEE